MVTLIVGNLYMTRKAGRVQIVEDLGAGRKRFVGQLLDQPETPQVSYFRNGSYSNSSKGGHAYDVVGPVTPSPSV